MGRKKEGGTQVVTLRLALATAKQLEVEASLQDKPLSTYLRELLEAYAPGTPTLDVKSLAERLSRTKIKLDGL
jgi:hypothetical protein